MQCTLKLLFFVHCLKKKKVNKSYKNEVSNKILCCDLRSLKHILSKWPHINRSTCCAAYRILLRMYKWRRVNKLWLNQMTAVWIKQPNFCSHTHTHTRALNWSLAWTSTPRNLVPTAGSKENGTIIMSRCSFLSSVPEGGAPLVPGVLFFDPTQAGRTCQSCVASCKSWLISNCDCTNDASTALWCQLASLHEPGSIRVIRTSSHR